MQIYEPMSRWIGRLHKIITNWMKLSSEEANKYSKWCGTVLIIGGIEFRIYIFIEIYSNQLLIIRWNEIAQVSFRSGQHSNHRMKACWLDQHQRSSLRRFSDIGVFMFRFTCAKVQLQLVNWINLWTVRQN